MKTDEMTPPIPIAGAKLSALAPLGGSETPVGGDLKTKKQKEGSVRWIAPQLTKQKPYKARRCEAGQNDDMNLMEQRGLV